MAASIPPAHEAAEPPAGMPPFTAMASSRRYGQRCPHCRIPGEIRSSAEEAPTLTVIYFSCRNPACGFTWRASLVFDFGLSPSAIPDPRMIDLPMRPIPRREALRAMADAAARPDPDQPGLFGP